MAPYQEAVLTGYTTGPCCISESSMGFEPTVTVLQTVALPLGYEDKQLERVTGIEPADICLEGSDLAIEVTPARASHGARRR